MDKYPKRDPNDLYSDHWGVYVVSDETDFSTHMCDNCGVCGMFIAYEHDESREFVECDSCGHLYLRQCDAETMILPEDWVLFRPG